MRRSGPSKTAELAAMTRALATCSGKASCVMDDPFAACFIGPAVGIPYLFNRLFLCLKPNFWTRGINSVGYLMALCRHRFMNDLIDRSIREGFAQIVIAGAGYDTTSLRKDGRNTEVKVFEVDHPATQSRKRRIIRNRSLQPLAETEYIALDLLAEPVAKHLADKGLDTGKPLLVIAEGIFSYLTQPAIDHLLQELTGVAAKIRLAADYRFPGVNDPAASPVIRKWRNQFRKMDEEYRSFFNMKDMEEMLTAQGYRITDHRNLITVWEEYSPLDPPDHLDAVAGIFIAEKMAK